MAITPEEIRNKTFSIHRRGYDQQEVSRYLAAIADELSSFNASTAASDDIVVAEVVGTDGVIESEAPVLTPDAEPDPEVSPLAPSRTDEFDRVGNEISIMLRQAQESAVKVRSDAEVEARTLVDQIRLDIEADRLAHEQAAGELIARTEERAAEVRDEAEEYAGQTRGTADTYAAEVRQKAEVEKSELTAAVEADRQLAADKLEAASNDAEATIADANRQAEEIIRQAQADAQAQSDQMLAGARGSLNALLDAERASKENLEKARENIASALTELRLTPVDSTSMGSS